MERLNPQRNGPMLEELAGRVEEEVLDRYKVEESKREAFRGRSAPLEWRRVRKKKRDKIRK